MRLRPAIALMLATVIVSGNGCSGGSDTTDDSPYRTYLERLSRTLQTEAIEAAPSAIPRPPRVGKLRQALPADSLDTLDFLALTGCEVQLTIGKRNSSLGRLAPASQRLLLNLEYLRLAPSCVSHLRANTKDALADTLQHAWQLKRKQLATLIFNATLGGEEYRAFWRGHASPGAYPAVTDATATRALTVINQLALQWLSGNYRADNVQFEILLSEVAGGGGGRLHRNLERQARWLAAADEALRERMRRGPLCADAIRHRAADILPGVVQRFFVDGIQARSADLNRSHYALLPQIAALENTLASALPDNYRGWMHHRNASLTWAMDAPRRHVQLLQAIQSPCQGTGGPAPQTGQR